MLREMLRARLEPEPEPDPDPLRMYKRSLIVELRYAEIRKDPFEMEAQVRLDLGDVQEFAFVPIRLVNEEKGTVKAALVGEKRDRIFVAFSPTNFGETRFYADADNLMEIAQIPDDGQG